MGVSSVDITWLFVLALLKLGITDDDYYWSFDEYEFVERMIRGTR